VSSAASVMGRLEVGRRGRVLLLAAVMGALTMVPSAPVGATFARSVGTAMLSAQEPLPAQLSFDQAVERALASNPAFLRQINQVAIAEHAERESLGSMLPSLNASLNFNGNTTRTRTAFDELGRPLEEPDFVETTGSGASQGLSGGVSLFNLQALRGYSASRAQTAVAEAGVELEAARLRTAVGQQYYRAVQRQRLIQVEERGLETAREQLDAIGRLLRVAARQPTDVLGAELQVARAEQAVAQARGEARKATLALNQVMGVQLSARYELASGFPAVFDPAALDLADLTERALRDGPRLEQEITAVTAADRSVSAARAARFPSLRGSYSYGRSTSQRGYGALGDLNPENSSWGFGLAISVPLFTGFQIGSQVGRASVQAENAREMLREARLALEQEVRAAHIDLENAYSAVQLAERSVEIARERLAQGQEQYRVGTIGYTDLQLMVNDVAQNERELINAYFSFANALLQLEEKVGGSIAG